MSDASDPTSLNRPHWMPKPAPPALDAQAVHEAAFSAVRSALRLHADEHMPVLTGETATIFRELNATRRVLTGVYWWTVVGTLALVSIAVKLWVFQ